jgi:hypothetical protein
VGFKLSKEMSHCDFTVVNVAGRWQNVVVLEQTLYKITEALAVGLAANEGSSSRVIKFLNIMLTTFTVGNFDSDRSRRP